MLVKIIAGHGPLNHLVKKFCIPPLKKASSKMAGNNAIINREVINLVNELILISAASCACLESSHALNFAAQLSVMGIILVNSANAPYNVNVRIKIPINNKTCFVLKRRLNPR